MRSGNAACAALHRLDRSRGAAAIGRLLPYVLGAGVLTFATYLYSGYRYGVWPQPGLFESVLRFDGALKNDWMTSLPPAHWALAHALGLLPALALDDAALTLWIAGLLALWTGVLLICRSLGGSWLGGIGAGLLAIPTGLDGLGLSTALTNYMYPTSLSFAFAILGFASLLRGWSVVAGGLLGVATVVHPNVGLLAAAAFAPATLAIKRPWRRALGGYLAAFLAVAFFPLLRVALDKALSSSLSASVRYGLVAIVRNPHHALYRVFPGAEYLHTLLWLAVLIVSVFLLRHRAAAQAITLATVAVATIALAGGLASEAGRPVVLVEAFTARVTPVAVLFGMVTASAAVTRRYPSWGPAALLLVFLAARRDTSTQLDTSAVEAVLVLLLLVLPTLARVQALRPIKHVSDFLSAARIPTIATVAALAAAVAAVAGSGIRHSLGPTPDQIAWQAVARAARARTAPRTIVLTPPDEDGFRFYARRPIVVDFGNTPFGKGEGGWARRLRDVTGNPEVVDPAFGTNIAARVKLISASYDRMVARSKLPVCRYDARFVVARVGVRPPRWLLRVYRNNDFALYRVRGNVCRQGT